MAKDRRIGERRQGERRKTKRGTPERRKFDRRLLLKIGAMATVGSFFQHPVFGAVDHPSPCKTLSLFNIHTQESLDVVYCASGEYVPKALHQINNILRDHRTGQTMPIDPGLLDLLHAISQNISKSSPIHIISGYRSSVTNAMLREKSKGVASRSLHMAGKAADIRIPGCDLKKLRHTAMALQIGGVGYYAESGFVHVDTGRVRYW